MVNKVGIGILMLLLITSILGAYISVPWAFIDFIVVV
ncbi:hypothetical protein [Bartonella rattaustraliani]|nr:hypothetical protein [Bartonella rattaustraliani]